MARLKVFTSAQGFFETVVAAPSQKAALDAWGAHQNLFASGMADVATDPAAIEAAQARPGQVLQRPAGTAGPFLPSADTALPDVPKIERPKSAKPQSKAPPTPKPADRSALTAAERALEAAEARTAAEQAQIDQERADLETREFTLHQNARQERKGLQAAVDRARRAYEKAGGA
jgi:hypothetical protein